MKPLCTFRFPYATSGSPAILVSSDKTPASSAVLPTASQLISPKAALVPMVAIADWAIVFTALIPAALNHFLVLSFTV